MTVSNFDGALLFFCSPSEKNPSQKHNNSYEIEDKEKCVDCFSHSSPVGRLLFRFSDVEAPSQCV